MVIGCIEALIENNIDYRDIEIIGFDNSQISLLYKPKITTIGYDIENMAEKAVEAMMNLMEGKK